jgi:hypothetical protein
MIKSRPDPKKPESSKQWGPREKAEAALIDIFANSEKLDPNCELVVVISQGELKWFQKVGSTEINEACPISLLKDLYL